MMHGPCNRALWLPVVASALLLLAWACSTDVLVQVHDCEPESVRCYEGAAQTCVDGAWRDRQDCEAIGAKCSLDAHECGSAKPPCCFVPSDPF